MLRYLTTVGFLLLSLAAVVWLIVCTISVRTRNQRHVLAKHFVLTVVLATPVVAYSFLYLVFHWWPPDWLERRGQSRVLQERIQAAGGWDVIHRDCIRLANQHEDEGFYWSRGHTNALPTGIATLKPLEVTFTSPKILQQTNDEPKVPVVRIRLFGMHSTGGYSPPYLGLEIVCEPQATDYRPEPSRGGASGNRYATYRKVADSIYEIY